MQAGCGPVDSLAVGWLSGGQGRGGEGGESHGLRWVYCPDTRAALCQVSNVNTDTAKDVAAWLDHNQGRGSSRI